MASNNFQYTFTFRFVNNQQTLALGVALPAICTLIVALRFLVRYLQNVRRGMDDWLSLGGLLAVVAMSACMIYGERAGVMGYPTPAPPTDLTADELLLYLDPTTELIQKIEFPFQIFMMIAYALIKLSIIAFYRRLFVVNKNSIFDVLTKIVTVIVVLWTVAFILMVIFACGATFSANWGTTAIQIQECSIAFTSEYGLAISDLILDMFVITLPLPLIWKLHLTTKRKVAVSGVILLGASAVGASVARLVLYVQTLRALTADIVVDINQSITVSLYWSSLEAGLALVAACLPSLSYLFSRFNVQTAIHSIRSVLSLNLLHSSQRSTPDSWNLQTSLQRSYSHSDVGDNSSSASHARIADKAGSTRVYALHDM